MSIGREWDISSQSALQRLFLAAGGSVNNAVTNNPNRNLGFHSLQKIKSYSPESFCGSIFALV